MMVDDVFASVGTANMDIRSFNQDFEANALIYDQAITRQLKQDYEEDIENSKEIFLEAWEKRPVFEKVQESVARMFSPLL